MTESEICNNLAQLEKFLSGLDFGFFSALGNKADTKTDIERWQQAVNAARAWIIARMAEVSEDAVKER